MSWVAVGSAAVGVAGSALSSRSAARGQGRAADAATLEQQRQYDLTRGDQAPYREAGTNALAQLVNLSGQYGQMPTAESVMATPGYQFGLDQGRNALQGSAAASGGLYSGQAGKDLVQFGNDYGTQQYDRAFNRQQTAENNIWGRYSELAGIGRSANQQVQQAGQNYATNVGNIGMANANAQGAATIAQGNALQNGLNQGVSWYNQRRQQPAYVAPQSSVGFGMPSGGGYEFADGGPVREPKVGSYSAVREGGGGGLSRNRLLTAMAEPQPQPMLDVFNPRAVMAMREQRADLTDGGMVQGPGGPRQDAIPAMLSNGEHVMDAATVNAMGGGSNETGQNRLNKLRMLMKRGQDVTGQRLETLPPKVREMYAAWGKN